MIRRRLITVLTVALALLAVPTLAAAADFSATGTMTGTSTAQAPEPGVAECTPQTAVDPEDYLCDFDASGTYDLDEVGTGSFAGVLRVDWSIYTGADPCAMLTGTLSLTGATGTLELALENTSRVCETSDPTVHDSSFTATVTGGTGDFADATGTLTGTGSMTAVSPGLYDTASDVAGTVTVPDPTPEPTVAPSEPADTASPSSAAPTPVADELPDAAATSATTTGHLAFVLLVTFTGALATMAMRYRLRG